MSTLRTKMTQDMIVRGLAKDTQKAVRDHRGSGVRCCSVEPGEIGLMALEGAGHGIN
jgi:hypothetical protein